MALCTCKKCGFSIGDEEIDSPTEDLEMQLHIIKEHGNYLGAIDAVLKVLQEKLQKSIDAQRAINNEMLKHVGNIPSGGIAMTMPVEILQLAQNRALYEYGIVLLEGIVKAVKEENWKEVVT